MFPSVVLLVRSSIRAPFLGFIIYKFLLVVLVNDAMGPALLHLLSDVCLHYLHKFTLFSDL